MSTIDYYQILRNSVLGGLNNQVNVPAAVAGSLATEIYHAKDSCQAIAAVVHPESYQRWTKEREEELLAAFAPVKMKFTVGSNKHTIIADIAHQVKRSPCAVIIRLKKLEAF